MQAGLAWLGACLATFSQWIKRVHLCLSLTNTKLNFLPTLQARSRRERKLGYPSLCLCMYLSERLYKLTCKNIFTSTYSYTYYKKAAARQQTWLSQISQSQSPTGNLDGQYLNLRDHNNSRKRLGCSPSDTYILVVVSPERSDSDLTFSHALKIHL